MPAPDPAYRGSEPFIFVSYSHADEATVYQEIRRLQERGVRVWYDTTGISAGAEWNDEIARAIREASAFLGFITSSFVASEHCRRELSFAQSLGRPVVAVHLEETEIPDGLRLSLENRQAIFRHRLTADVYDDMLLEAVGGIVAKRASPDSLAPSARPDRSGSYRLRWMAILAVIFVAALVALFWPEGDPDDASQYHAIAVLPFEDLSSGADQQHFGDGIADEIRDELTGLDGLRIVARTSSFAARDGRDLKSIAEELGVTNILEGSIRRNGDRVRITAQLIDAEDSSQLWSEVYERELTDIFAIQDEIAAAVAGALGVTLGVGDVNDFSGAGTYSVEAYEAFLKARAASSSESIRLLKRAVGIDPEYAAAWAKLGQQTAATMWYSLPEGAPGIIDESIEYLLRAIQLEPNSAYAYSLLGTVNYALMDWSQSETYFQRSLAIAPKNETLQNYANMLMRAGRSTEAISVSESTHLPVEFLPINAYLALGRVNIAAEVDVAIAPAQRPFFEFLIALNEGDRAEVVRTLGKLPRTGVGWAKFLEAVLQDGADSEQVLDVLRATLADGNAVWPSKYNDIGLLAAHFGDPELAFSAIEREFRLTTIRLFTLWFPVMREVRQLPGFKQLIADMNLPEYWRAYGWSDHCRQIGELDFDCG